MTLKPRYFIDSHKAATPVFVFALIAAWGRWDNVAAWAYLALHGGYGLLWVLKSRWFGDAQWEKPCTLVQGLSLWVALSLYWIAPWILCSRDVHPSAAWIGACIATWGFGVFFHFVADMQKDCWMKLQRGRLLTEGMWSRLRNPNYFGELLIYVGFSALALHPLPLAALAAMVVGVWVPNMRRKDASLSRYPEFAAWKARSRLFLPGLW